ncbi:MAG TPA: alpha/beta hydrolase-fold protein [Bryobacteraceae bacterium]|nr:alpha/beta hydrolase-fold protein [Bryobacteraceae bacterium]
MQITRKIAIPGSIALTLALCFSVYGQAPAGPARGGINREPDPRVQQRKYHFVDTNEDLPYALFVSSKVAKDKKAPLIVALHGVFGDGNSLLRGNALDLAEAGGYIVVGPMGYNPQGWFGSPVIVMNGPPGRGRGDGAGARRGDAPGAGRGGPPPTPEPPNLAELSEKDVLNVLALVRKEFTIDDKRTYLMGHSMGGAGALFLGPKYVDQWAAVASMAPAAFRMDPSQTLTPAKDKMPLFLAHGDADTVVPIDVGRRWAKAATDLHMKDFKYLELPGADHGTVITQSMPEIFKFFEARTR